MWLVTLSDSDWNSYRHAYKPNQRYLTGRLDFKFKADSETELDDFYLIASHQGTRIIVTSTLKDPFFFLCRMSSDDPGVTRLKNDPQSDY